MEKAVERPFGQPALVSDGAAARLHPSGFDRAQVYRSQGYAMFVDHVSDERGDPVVELWRFSSEDDAVDGHGWLEVTIHEIVETAHSGTLAVYYRQWFAPDGQPAWGNRKKRVIGAVGSLKALIRRRKMQPAAQPTSPRTSSE